MSENINFSAEQKRELGKEYLLNCNGDYEKKKVGVKLLLEAHAEKDYEATYIVSRLMLDGVLVPRSEMQDDHALQLMQSAANSGFLPARAYLNAYCAARYNQSFNSQTFEEVSAGPLVDFEGNPIKIDRQGFFTPVDAVLEYKDGHNVLILSTNVAFVFCDEIKNFEKFGQAVFDGILAWEGDYEVFGGQKLSVQVNLTNDDRVFDNLLVMPITGEFGETIKSAGELIVSKDQKAIIDSVINHKRSFASIGLKWSVHSRKVIYLQSRNGNFDDYEEIKHVTKHEFGHALGLGDLYASQVDHLEGIEKGTYTELDSYSITDRIYNLAMCDHHGPISNNDIEMIILAFKENKAQLYQQSKTKGKISSALGKGN